MHIRVRDYLLILIGSAIFACGLDCFEIPNGLAAGGASGLATVLAQVFSWRQITVPVGLQVLAMNCLLMIPVVRTGGLKYAARTVAGVVASSVLTDALVPVLPVLGGNDLLLCAIWGGVVCGLGLGLVFRAGGNTGGTDIVAQLVSRRTGVSVGAAESLADFGVILASVAVFGLEKALYATVAMYVCNHVVDMVVDGVSSQRAAYIISDRCDELRVAVLHELGRGCTELMARGGYTGDERPILFVVISRSEYALLKSIVAREDKDAIVFVSEVYEAFGEGFRQLEG